MCRPPADDRRQKHRDPGQGIVEYGLILALSVLFAIVILVVFEAPLAEILSAIGRAIEG